MALVGYAIHGKNGNWSAVHDYCFRGVSMGTPPFYIYEYDVFGNIPEDEDKREFFESIREDIDFVAYEVPKFNREVISELKAIVDVIPWLKDVVIPVDEKYCTKFLVIGDIPGDHLFHALSSLRNIATHHWESYKNYRKTLGHRESFVLQMFCTQTTDYRGKPFYNGYNHGQDYMWANFSTITRGAVKSVVENGPRWYLEKGHLKYSGEKLPFEPSVKAVDPEEEGSISWDSSRFCQLFRSFELPAGEDPDPQTFDSPLELVNYVKELLK